jgi:hypothetical protein
MAVSQACLDDQSIRFQEFSVAVEEGVLPVAPDRQAGMGA